MNDSPAEVVDVPVAALKPLAKDPAPVANLCRGMRASRYRWKWWPSASSSSSETKPGCRPLVVIQNSVCRQ